MNELSKIMASFDVIYGLVGFQRFSRWTQLNFNRNITKRIVDRATQEERKIDVIGIQSSHDELIERASIHDRLDYLRMQAIDLERANIGYGYSTLSPNSFVVRNPQGREVYFVNAQKVIALEQEKRQDLIAIGTNSLEQNLSLDQVIEICEGEGLGILARSPFQRRFAPDRERCEELAKRLDGMVCASEASPDENYKTNIFATQENIDLPVVWISNAHTISNIGTAHIGFDRTLIKDPKNLVPTIKRTIRQGAFANFQGYEGRLSGLSWRATLGLYELGEILRGKPQQ